MVLTKPLILLFMAVFKKTVLFRILLYKFCQKKIIRNDELQENVFFLDLEKVMASLVGLDKESMQLVRAHLRSKQECFSSETNFLTFE